MSQSPSHEVKRPVAQFYDPNSCDKTPLAALLAALSKTQHRMAASDGLESQESAGAAAFTARLCTALSLQRDSLLSNIQNGKTAQGHSQTLAQPAKRKEQTPTENSSSQAPLPQRQEGSQGADVMRPGEGMGEPENSSADNNGPLNATSDKQQQSQPLSEEAKKKRRQEINRESARRVRKRKTEAHVQLQEEVIALKTAATSAAADQAVIVRYASELTKERDTLLQRSAQLENKWIAAECRNVILRQRIADLTGLSLQQVAPDTGQVMSHTASEQQTEGTAPESSTHFHLPNKPQAEGHPSASQPR